MMRYGSSSNGFNWGSAGFTLPAMRSVSSADRLHGTLTLHNSTCSEMLQSAQPFVSGSSAVRQLSSKHIYEDCLDDVFLPDRSHLATLRSERQKAFWENQTIPRTSSQLGDAVWVTPNAAHVVQDMRQWQETVRKQPSVVSTQATKIAGVKQHEAAAQTIK